MNESIFNRIKSNQDFYLKDFLPKLIPGGKWQGESYTAASVQGGVGKSFSFSLGKGIGNDFAGNDNAKDIIDLAAEVWGLDKIGAAKRIEQEWGLDKNLPASVKKKKPRPEFIPVHPVPASENLTIPAWWIKNKGEVLGRWCYHNRKGEPIGWVVKFTDESARAVPFQWCGKDGWQSVGFPKPRPLYNLHKLVDKATVLIVEGEKCADAADKLFPSLVCLSWMGGVAGHDKADWEVLAGRGVIIWRDNDTAHTDKKTGAILPPYKQPGKLAEVGIANILSDLGCRIRVFKDNALEEKPDGWDVADMLAEGDLSGPQALDWIKGNITEYQRGGAGGVPPRNSQKSAHQKPLNPYFKCLGQVVNKYYFYNYSSGQVVSVGHDGFSEMFLLSLSNGSREYWETEGRKKPDYKEHGGSLMAQCHSQGQFDLSNVLGRGTWKDEDRFVTNTGDGLIVGDKKIPMNDFESDYIYLRSRKLDQAMTSPANRAELQELLVILEEIRWEDAICAKLFAGWIMAAPICGALPWRSHIYIAGPTGSGKTWLFSDVISPLLKKVSMRVSSKTSEAGIRHKMGADALPVIFDEAEAESLKDAMRMQEIMDLARQASSEDGAPILKGTANQEGAKEFYIRSSFCFLSIMPSIRQYADETRITILGLKHKDAVNIEESKARFKELSQRVGAIIKGDFADRFISYSIKSVEAMRANFEIFADVGVGIFGNRRFADQIAMLLAGYYAYFSNGIITEADATELLKKYNWESVIPSRESNNQARLLTRISQFAIDVQVKQKPSEKFNRTIGELVEYLSKTDYEQDEIEMFSISDVEQALKRRGIKYDNDFQTVIIANNSEFLKTILANTPWASNWHQALKAIAGAAACEKTVAFGGFNSRAMSVPVETFLDTSDII